MRTVVDAVFSKVKKMSVSEMNKLADQILPEVHTNISKAEIKEVMADIPSYSIGESMGWPYNVTGKMINKIWYGIPNTLRSSVQRLHKDFYYPTDIRKTKTKILKRYEENYDCIIDVSRDYIYQTESISNLKSRY